ncbi:MAG: hypothetical protein QXK89_05395 [Candidatus Bathyarchaeia archaeon]|nr:hypothetical protein [Candidatus Bathyarchaeota archaeon]
MDVTALLVGIIVNTIFISPVLWLSGRMLAGKEKAKFTDSLWIVLLGTVIGTMLSSAIGRVIGGIAAAIIMMVIWLALIKHFFDCGWLKALAIAIIAVILFIIIIAILALVGFAIISLL